MTRAHFALSTLVASLLAGGCAQLEVHRIPKDQAKDPLVGKVPYYLPRTAVDVTGSLTLNKCEWVKNPSEEPGAPSWVFNLEFEKALVAAPVTEPDEDHRYYIDYESSRGLLKEIKFQVDTYPNRTLQNYSGEVNDQAGPLLVAAASAIINISGASRVGRVYQISRNQIFGLDAQGDIAAKKPDNALLCGEAALAALGEVAKREAEIKSLGAKRSDALTKPTFSEAHLAGILAQYDQGIARYRAEIAKLKAGPPLARTFASRWTPSLSDKAVTQPAGRVALQFRVDTTPLVRDWLSATGKGWVDGADPPDVTLKAWQGAKSPVILEALLDGHSVVAKPEPAGDAPGGIVVREPAYGVLRICEADCTVATATLTETTRERSARVPLAVGQLGQLLVLPQKSALFENAHLAIKLNADGTIASIGHRSVSAAAQGLAGASAAAKDYATAVAAGNTAATAINAARAAEAQYPNVVNQALSACLTAATAIRNAGGTPAPCQ